jgi:hypothetical protein
VVFEVYVGGVVLWVEPWGELTLALEAKGLNLWSDVVAQEKIDGCLKSAVVPGNVRSVKNRC